MAAYEDGASKAVLGIHLGNRSSTKERGWNAKQEIVRLMSDAGDGARGIIRIGWAKFSGHVFNVRNENGKVIYYDAQNGRVDASGYFKMAFTGEIGHTGRRGIDFLRVDNLAVSRRIGDFIKPKS
ncbi:MAG: hypothetical protein IJ783_00565 [Kiritimatiellae bacterium]|nr:hypothetical protein [Kiritimatiellia bacterium]